MKKLNLFNLFKNSYDYFCSKWQIMLLFSAVNYLIMVGAIYSWSTPTFLFLMVFAYAFWSYFFRFYFNREPYFSLKPMLGSLVPSTKILFIVILFVSILIVLPFIPMLTAFVGIHGEWQNTYQDFLYNYIQEGVALDVGLAIVFILVSPYIFYRPFFAWISAVIGRSGAIKNAFLNTKGNYWQFVFVMLILNMVYFLLQQGAQYLGIPMPVYMIIGSPLIVYSNIIIINSYEFFFIE